MFLRSFPVDNEEYVHPEDDELYSENSHYQDDEDTEDYDNNDYQFYEENSECNDGNEENSEYYDENEENSEYYEGTEENTEYYEGNDTPYNGNSQETSFSCESCDKDFYSKAQYDNHMSEHRMCNLDGCTFTAHFKVIEKHVLMQHATGLYDKIRNLNTPEDIAKWVEERKRRYPNRENILKRQEQQEEKLKRGMRIKKNENRFGKDKFRLKKAENKKPPPKKKSKRPFIKETKPVSLINEKIDWNGAVYPFKGTSTLESDSEKEKSDFEDEEWSSAPSIQPVAIKFNNSLGALMGAYMSGEDTDEEVMEIKQETKIEVVKEIDKNKEDCNIDKRIQEKNEDSDGEPPTEVKIEKVKLPEPVIENKETQVPDKSDSTSRIRKRKRPLNRTNNKYVPFKHRNNKNYHGHSRSRNQSSTKKNNFPYAFRRRRVTLLEKLLDNEIRHERNVLLQCVRYTVQNNFFQDKPNCESTSEC